MNQREDFYCHNCIQSDHMSDSCSELKIFYKQRMNNHRKIDEMLTESIDEATSAASIQTAENFLDTIFENADKMINS